MTLRSLAASRTRRALPAVALAVVAVVTGAAPLAAQPTTTITFNDLAGGQATYASQGYVFGCVNADLGTPCSSLTTVAPGSAGYTGSPALFNNNAVGITTLARQDGAAFNLLSLAMAPFTSNAANLGPVVFEGRLAGGGTVVQTFTLSGAAGVLTTFTFSSEFRNLLSVRYRGRDFAPAFTGIVPSVDNVVVQQFVPTAVVPEPGTWALVAAGLAGVGGMATRRRRPAA
jgi:hypothetical protein